MYTCIMNQATAMASSCQIVMVETRNVFEAVWGEWNAHPKWDTHAWPEPKCLDRWTSVIVIEPIGSEP